MGRSKEMPQDVADYLATVVKPLRVAIGSQTDAEKVWGISQSHISQIENGAGCGSAVLLILRAKLDLSLEDLCFPPGKRKASKSAPTQRPLDLDAVRDVVRTEIAQLNRASTEPPPPTLPSSPKGKSDAPRPRRR